MTACNSSLGHATKKHDHRQSLWIIAGGCWLWCYRCGAIRKNTDEGRWIKPTGQGGKNPALNDKVLEAIE